MKPYKNVLIVGEFYFDLNIKSQYKYVIDIDENLLIRRRFDRHLDFMSNNKNKYFKKASDRPLCVDLSKWKNERIYWGYNRDEYYEISKKKGYIKADQSIIIENIKKLIIDSKLDI